MFSDIFTGIGKQKKLDAVNQHLIRVKPAIDIYETDHAIVVSAEMPNVEKEDLHVAVENNMLHITGKRINILEKGTYLLRETNDVMYERSFELGDDLDTEKVEAKYNAGILTVTIVKREKAKTQKIEIK
jgi:HSP20 family protein